MKMNRQGRDRSSNKRGNNKKKGNNGGGNHQKKKNITDYVYYVGSAKQASDYEITTEYIINYIKKTYDYGIDIGKALESLTETSFDSMKPALRSSSKTDAKELARENKQFEKEFDKDYDAYRKRASQYEQNKVKAYALIWERCSKGMQNKVESRTDFVSRIKDEPLELLKAIKEHALNYQETRYVMSIVTDSLRHLMNTKQQEKESLQDYTRRFRVAKEVLESHVGTPISFPKVTAADNDYTVNDTGGKNEECRKRTANRFYAYLYIENSDQDKYGSVLKGLNSQHSLKNDQYPQSIAEANNVLSQHKYDNKGNNSNGKDRNNRNNRGDNNNRNNSNQEETDELKLSFAQMEGMCYCCGKSGHKSPNCRHKDKIPRNEWAINKLQQQYLQQKPASSSTASVAGTATETTSRTGSQEAAPQPPVPWCVTQLNVNLFEGTTDMRKYLLLDSDSSVSLIARPELVTDIRPAEQFLYLLTNGGTLVVKHKATLPGYGEVWFSTESVTNVLSLADAAEKFHITYDSRKENAFIMHVNDKMLEFKRMSSNIYARELSGLAGIQNITTVEENHTFYTSRQYDKAKRARDLYHALGTPSVDDMKAVIRMNLIANNPVTTKDIVLAEKIFGKDIGSLKGKSTRRKPIPVVENQIEIPSELIKSQRDVTLCVDGMKVNGIDFLTTISRNLYYRTATSLKSKKAEDYLYRFKEVIRMYKKGGFEVKRIHADNEFRPLTAPLQDDHNIELNFANPQEHVPEAERNNRTIQERVRANYHRLPYRRLPKLLVITLVQETPRKLNFFPAKHGVSKYYSPRMILHQRTLDYQLHCQIPTGAYVQASNEPIPSNTNDPRTLDCIYLRYNDNEQGGHECLHLPTNQRVTRRYATMIPITPHVIRQVDRIAERENMPEGLKITNKFGTVLYDSAWTAGVDYDIDEDDDDSTYIENDDDDDDDEMPELVDHYDSDSDDDDDDEDDEEEMPQSEAAVKKSVLSVSAGDRIMEALERADQEQKDIVAFKRSEGGQGKQRMPNPLLFGFEPAQYVLWILRSVRSAELEQSLLVLPLTHIERLVYYLILLLREGRAVELCSRIAVFVTKTHQHQVRRR